MKKFLVCLSVLAIACVSITGALAIVPHGHGDDLDHSQHESCPVYQAGLQSTVFIVAVWAFALFLHVAVRHESREPFFLFFTRLTPASLRAPPSIA